MSDTSVPMPASVRWMRIFAGIVLAAVAAYYALTAVERTGVHARSVRGTVVNKRHVPSHRTYVTEVINGRSMVVPRDVADAYVVDLALPGGAASGVVTQELYDRLAAGDSVTVDVRQRRLSRALDVLQVSR